MESILFTTIICYLWNKSSSSHTWEVEGSRDRLVELLTLRTYLPQTTNISLWKEWFIHLTANKLNAYYVSDPGDTMENRKYNHSPYGTRSLLKEETESLRTKGIKVSDMLCFNSIIFVCGLLNTRCCMHLRLYRVCLLPGIAFFPFTNY